MVPYLLYGCFDSLPLVNRKGELILSKPKSIYTMDLETIKLNNIQVPTATLSLKIFRTKFLNKDIFILPQSIDSFIRPGYYGGGTDVYKAYGELLYYYDVNSLYPYAM
jgi:hypothetical protein